MKKVWILEALYTAEEMKRDLDTYLDMIQHDEIKNCKEHLETANILISTAKRHLEEYPNGKWVGYQGKTNYRQFCECACETLSNKNFISSKEFRVVEALIDDDATYWTNYKVVKENPGVLKYLLSQVKYR